jgi:hypothetical protein
MSVQNWYRIESESQMVPIDTLERIENALGIDLGTKEWRKQLQSGSSEHAE